MRSRDAHVTVQILLQAKGDPNQIDRGDVNQQVPTVSPLVYAASYDLPKVVTMLLHHGADPLDTRVHDYRGIVAFALTNGHGVLNAELKQAMELTFPGWKQHMEETYSQGQTDLHTPLSLGKTLLKTATLTEWMGHVQESNSAQGEVDWSVTSGTKHTVGVIGALIETLLLPINRDQHGECDQLIDQLTRLRSGLLEFERIIDGTFSQVGLRIRLTQLMVQEGFESGVLRPNDTEVKHMESISRVTREHLLPFKAEALCFTNEFEVAVLGPLGLYIFDMRTGRACVRIPILSDTETLRIRMAANYFQGAGSSVLATVDCEDDDILIWETNPDLDTSAEPPASRGTIPTSRLLQRITSHKDAATLIAFSGDGTTLVSGSQDCSVRVFKRRYPTRGNYIDNDLHSFAEPTRNFNEWTMNKILTKHNGPISALSISQDGGMIASGDTKGVIRT